MQHYHIGCNASCLSWTYILRMLLSQLRRSLRVFKWFKVIIQNIMLQGKDYICLQTFNLRQGISFIWSIFQPLRICVILDNFTKSQPIFTITQRNIHWSYLVIMASIEGTAITFWRNSTPFFVRVAELNIQVCAWVGRSSEKYLLAFTASDWLKIREIN